MKKLTQQEVDFLQELYYGKDFQNKGLLREFIICNTYEPQYKKGDYVKVTNRQTMVYGLQVKEFNAKVIDSAIVAKHKEREYVRYSLIAKINNREGILLSATHYLNGKQDKDNYITGISDTDNNQINWDYIKRFKNSK